MIECWKMLVGRLAVWGWLLLLPYLSSVTCIPHNNTCYRIKSVEVRVAVPLQEPATFRSYTWCLKVPPRCSKYTVIMRERITYQTEVRNETVSECCTGFVSLHDECVATCPTCTNMRCDAHNRTCTCAPGYIGPYCNQTCEAGKWGDRCGETCVCRVGEDCDFVTGSCSLTTSTTSAPSTALPTTPSTVPVNTATTRPSTIASSWPRNIPTTPNAFINLTLKEPTTSTEDLTEFNVISKPRNDSVRVNKNLNGNDENSLNALSDLDYPILPTDSLVEASDLQVEYEQRKTFVVNSLNVNGSMVNDRWIGELGTHSGVTLGSMLALLALFAVVVSAVIRCRNNKTVKHQSPLDNTSLHLVARSSHYAVPGPPSFSFINGYNLNLVKEVSEDMYDHPRGARCLVDNEPVYDELRY